MQVRNKKPKLMSRHTKTKQHVDQEMGYMDQAYDDQYDEEDDQFTQQQWDVIYNLCDVASVNKNIAIEALKDANGEFEKALLIIQKEQQKEKQKQQKKQKEEQQKTEKARLRAQQKAAKQVKQQVPRQLNNQKSSSSQHGFKKSTSSDMPYLQQHISRRKSSHIVEQYDTDHYNINYPSLQVDKNIQPSKTINIVVVGHVDSGKSTLVGMLLHQIKFISKKEQHKNEKESIELGKQSFKYAFVTDQMAQERERGVTIDVGVKKIELLDRQIVFLDSPGHRDFIPNMITGAAQADYAVLVIDVTHFQSTFISGGQTKEHAYIVKSLGVAKLIVAMNKMDLVKWSPQAFEQIKKKLNFYLFKIGFKEAQIQYVPVSAYFGMNITKKLDKPFESGNSVYKSSLLQIIQRLEMPVRPINKPLRINITNFYEAPIGKLKGHCVSGKIEGGVLRKDEKVVILPQNCQCLIKQIVVGNDKVKEAKVGDNIDIQIKLIDQTYFQTIKFGNVISSLKYSIPVSKKFVVEALALQLDVPILKGTPVIVYIGANRSPARITKINYIFNPNDGTIIKKNPKSIRSNDCAEIQIQTEKQVCVQLFSNFKIFGRVIIREKNNTLCVGTVKLVK